MCRRVDLVRAPSIYPIPADPIMAADPDFSGTQVGGDFSMWQGMITDVSGYTLEPSGLPGSPPVTVFCRLPGGWML